MWIFAKNMGDPYYEPTIVVHDGVTNRCVHSEVASLSYVVLVLVLADTVLPI